MEKKEIKLNHFNIFTVIALIALIYFSVKCIQFYFEMEVPKEIWETIILKKTIFISNEKNISTKLLENLLFLLLVFLPPLLVYLFVKKIYKICNYFLSEEKIIISDEYFYYTRKLAIINFEKFEIKLKEIKRIGFSCSYCLSGGRGLALEQGVTLPPASSLVAFRVSFWRALPDLEDDVPGC